MSRVIYFGGRWGKGQGMDIKTYTKDLCSSTLYLGDNFNTVCVTLTPVIFLHDCSRSQFSLAVTHMEFDLFHMKHLAYLHIRKDTSKDISVKNTLTLDLNEKNDRH